jgi:dinuclear metal center YbgI/SA1388 family protein
MGVTVHDVTAALWDAYPARLAEDWDTGIGLTCGDPDSEVRRVLLAVDIDPAVVRQAREIDAQLIVTHHPLLFRHVQTVAAATDKGRLIYDMIRAGVAHFAAHTNADRAVGGVNDALAEALGLRGSVPLVPSSSDDPREGLGRVGELAAPMLLGEFARHVAERLPGTAGGVRIAGEPGRTVRRVAVCGGAGGSTLPAATAAGADACVTSDLTHHVATEHAADPARPALVDVAHWAGEWPWLARAAAVIDAACRGAVATTVSAVRTDAWTGRFASPSEQL